MQRIASPETPFRERYIRHVLQNVPAHGRRSRASALGPRLFPELAVGTLCGYLARTAIELICEIADAILPLMWRSPRFRELNSACHADRSSELELRTRVTSFLGNAGGGRCR